jgi:hypothetical protein
MQGLGDVISYVTTFFGVEPCEACLERKRKLNSLFPFINSPSDKELEFLDDFFSWYSGLPIPANKALKIAVAEKIWARIYGVDLTKECRTCGSQYQEKYIKQLKNVYENSRIS